MNTVVYVDQTLIPLSDPPKTPRKAPSTDGAFTRESGDSISGPIHATSSSQTCTHYYQTLTSTSTVTLACNSAEEARLGI